MITDYSECGLSWYQNTGMLSASNGGYWLAPAARGKPFGHLLTMSSVPRIASAIAVSVVLQAVPVGITPHDPMYKFLIPHT